MKIGFIVEHYPPTEGGVATSAQRVARELIKQNTGVYVVCFDSTISLDSEDCIIEEEDSGVIVFRIGPFFLKHKTVNVNSISENLKATFRRRAFNQMISVLKDKNIDCILSFYLINAGYLAHFVAKALKVPFVAGVRGNDIGRNIFNVERFAVTQWIVRGADKLVCVNEHLNSRMLLAFPEVSEKSIVIPNGVISRKQTINKKNSRARILELTGWAEDNLILVFNGTLREKKGVVPLMRALENCGNSNKIKLLVVGPEIGSVELKMCGPIWDALKLSNTIFVTGGKLRDEVNDWVVGGDVIIMPSLDDGMANGLLEGMALALCPIATEIFSDVIQHDVNGLLVQTNNAKALAEAFNYLFVNRSEIERLGLSAQFTIESNHSPQTEATKYIELFKTVL